MLETVFLIAVLAPLAVLAVHLASATRGATPEPPVVGRRRPVTARRPPEARPAPVAARAESAVGLGHAPDEVRALRQAGLTPDSIIGVPAVERAIEAEVYVLSPVVHHRAPSTPGRAAAHARPGGTVITFPSSPTGRARDLTAR